MPNAFSKFLNSSSFSANNFTDFISEFISDYRKSIDSSNFFEKIGSAEYERILREEERQSDNLKMRKKRTLLTEENVDYNLTNWGRFISDPEVKDPDSRKGRLFRRRFR